jgi:hypothetical protein
MVVLVWSTDGRFGRANQRLLLHGENEYHCQFLLITKLIPIN